MSLFKDRLTRTRQSKTLTTLLTMRWRTNHLFIMWKIAAKDLMTVPLLLYTVGLENVTVNI